MAGLFKLFGQKKARQAAGFTHPVAPDQPFLAIGDVHGRADLLEQLERIILERAPGLPAVFVGDYIDRGDHSAQVLDLLMSSSEGGVQPVFCLRGNHEAMCLRFLDNPIETGPRWLRFGGLQTLASYGIKVPDTNKAALQRIRDDLAMAMGDATIDWLRARPVIWSSGNVHVTHAGADPARPMTEQLRKHLVWGHQDFDQKTRTDGQWVVHGHVIMDTPQANLGRIAIDTGAYVTGRLTAALIADGSVQFLST
ncbi:metallophosphoesterase [Thalassovita sp.]|uniref:metallophosphoesterase n=1 Tax=Thalassovita sp. TaxID=1979401 RepID=UPI0029DE86CB|nr:metallophosphoesterase [Thalassovita sp.]